MEIQGTVLSKYSDRITIVTEDKMQEIDIFVTSSRKTDIVDLIEREFVQLSVQIQSVEYKGEKLGKLWLLHVIFPRKIVKDTRRGRKGEGDRNWSDGRK